MHAYDSHNDVTMSYYSPVPIISVKEFFHDDSKTSWKPLPEHDLKQSPCYPIIDIRNYHNYKISFYYCKLHPDIENVYLETIEHHCKYSNPEVHKLEILKLTEKAKKKKY